MFLFAGDEIQKLLHGGEAQIPIYVTFVEFAFAVLCVWNLYARRLHDLGFSTWWLAVVVLVTYAPNYVPIVGGLLSGVIYLTMIFWPGKNGDNSYGPPVPSGRGIIDAYLNR